MSQVQKKHIAIFDHGDRISQVAPEIVEVRLQSNSIYSSRN